MEKGQIILLNGASSSGKTTIARALQEKFSIPYLNLSPDDFLGKLSAKYQNPATPEEIQIVASTVQNILRGFPQVVAALARTGNSLIVEHVLQEDEWLWNCVESWEEFSVLFVGVKCPVEVLEDREKRRSDRERGIARYQSGRVHIGRIYDLEVDTSKLTPDQCAEQIIKSLNAKKQSAFTKMMRINRNKKMGVEE